MSESFLSCIKRRLSRSSTLPTSTSADDSTPPLAGDDKHRFAKRVDPKTVSKNIDRQIAIDQKKNSRRFRILLLGGSNCGKTTIFRQMRILHLDGFTDGDKESYRDPIRRNTIDSLGQLIEACNSLRIVHDSSLQTIVEQFCAFRKQMVQGTDSPSIPPQMCHIMKRLWKSSAISTAYQRRWNFYLLDSAKYFLDSLERIAAEDYVPEVQDILQCRFPTIGTEEIEFKYQNMNFTMVDVGGQRSERRKWVHVFDNVNMCLFVAALSDYDSTDPDNAAQNRLTSNHYIFKTIASSSFFQNAAIVLFLNKYDTFQEKIPYEPLNKYYKEYTGPNEAEPAGKYLGDYFRRHVRDKTNFFLFYTTATDTRNIEFMFGSAVAHIINQNLRATGSY